MNIYHLMHNDIHIHQNFDCLICPKTHMFAYYWILRNSQRPFFIFPSGSWNLDLEPCTLAREGERWCLKLVGLQPETRTGFKGWRFQVKVGITSGWVSCFWQAHFLCICRRFSFLIVQVVPQYQSPWPTPKKKGLISQVVTKFLGNNF